MVEKPEFSKKFVPFEEGKSGEKESKKTSIFEKLFKRPKISKKEKLEPSSRFEKSNWVKTKEFERLFKRRPDSQLRKDFWMKYRKQPGEVWDKFSQEFPELKKPWISKKDFEKVKKEVLKREKWAKDWEEKKKMRSYIEILEKIEKE